MYHNIVSTIIRLNTMSAYLYNFDKTTQYFNEFTTPLVVKPTPKTPTSFLWSEIFKRKYSSTTYKRIN